MFGKFRFRGRGGGLAKMITSFVFWATLNFVNGPLVAAVECNVVMSSQLKASED